MEICIDDIELANLPCGCYLCLLLLVRSRFRVLAVTALSFANKVDAYLGTDRGKYPMLKCIYIPKYLLRADAVMGS